MLLGGGGEERAQEALQGGQAGLIVHLPPGSPAPDLPAPARTSTNEAELTAAILGIPGPLPRRVSIQPTGDPKVDEAFQRRVAKTVELALRSKKLQLQTIALHGPTWVQHGLANLPTLARIPSIACLQRAFAGRPAVIVSPGPSLSKNLPLLREVKGKALLLTGTHALPSFRSIETPADLVIAADAGDLKRHFVPEDITSAEALLVAATCHPESLRIAARRRFSFAGNGPVDDWIFQGLGEEAGLSTGGSVACSALSLAVHLGCDPIVFIGQDLSFPDGRFYAKETVDGDATIEAVGDEGFFLRKPEGSESPGVTLDDGGKRFTGNQRLIDVPGYHGGTVKTSEAFQAFLAWFAATADGLRGHHRLVNSTEGGARIDHMEQAPFADVIAGWEPLPASIGDVLDARGAKVDLAARHARVRSHIVAMADALQPCGELAARCTQLTHDVAADRKRLPELEAAEAELHRAVRPLLFLSLVAQGPIQRAQELARQAKGPAQTLIASRTLFSVVEAGCRALDAPLRRAVDELGGEL